jgi:hypothetical protein
MGGLRVRNVKSYGELIACVETSVKNYRDEFFPTDKNKSIAWLNNHVNSGGFFKVLEDSTGVVGYGAATICKPTIYSNQICLSQVAYHTTTKGRKAIEALRLFHKAMIDFARLSGVTLCVTSSILDNQDTFTRILERDGWTRRGGTLVMRVDP